METPQEWIEAGAWVGRQQAFAVIASKCTAAQALALKQVRESRSYESLGITWEQFCGQYAGISRSYADDLIRRHDEFGDAYFRLCEIARLSPETYRRIAGRVTADSIEVDGESLPLTRANAARIRAAIKRLRQQLHQAQTENAARLPTVEELTLKFNLLMAEAVNLTSRAATSADYDALFSLAGYVMKQWAAFLHLPVFPDDDDDLDDEPAGDRTNQPEAEL